MTGLDRRYLSYLLRLRRVDNGGRPVWRLSLEPPGRGDARHFSSVDDLLDYLRSQMHEADAADPEATHGKD